MAAQTNVLDAAKNLGVWKRNGEQAPHKPLLLLLAIAAMQQGVRWLRFRDVEGPLHQLIREFGPPRRSEAAKAHYPFWYLRSDGIWEVKNAEQFVARKGKSREPGAADLRRKDAYGGFTDAAFAELSKNHELCKRVIQVLLDKSFPATIHDDVRSAAGLPSGEGGEALNKRDAAFREQVLQAYGYRCAVCGYDGQVGHLKVGLEAAHIRWVQANGPSSVVNGIAMCSLHHKLYDMGAFRIHPEDFRILFSRELRGTSDAVEVLLRAHGTRLRLPRSRSEQPDRRYLEWHSSERFRVPDLEI
jgi:putative restriction endonuclease